MRLERGGTWNACRTLLTGLSTIWRSNMPPTNHEKRLLKRCRAAGNWTGRGWGAIEAEGSVEGVKITDIKGMCNKSATMEAANCGAAAISRSACKKDAACVDSRTITVREKFLRRIF